MGKYDYSGNPFVVRVYKAFMEDQLVEANVPQLTRDNSVYQRIAKLVNENQAVEEAIIDAIGDAVMIVANERNRR